MQLFTSRYQAAKEIIGCACGAVSTSVGSPRFKLQYPIIGHMPELAPSRDMIHMARPVYEPLYLARLEKAGVDRIHKALMKIAETAKVDRLALLCFEDIRKPGEWCHRRIFAQWWMERTGEEIPELDLAEHRVLTAKQFLHAPGPGAAAAKPKASATPAQPPLFEW